MSLLPVQKALKAAGYDPGPLDGLWGPRTEFALDSALTAAQRCEGVADADLVAELTRDEGKVRHAYQDSLGYWTIGVGRLIDKRRGGGLSDDEIAYLLRNDIRKVEAQVASLPAWEAVRDDPVRRRALLNMAFQLGIDGLRGFVNSLAMIARKDWAGAGSNLRKSLWYRQTPSRAERVVRMIETGRA